MDIEFVSTEISGYYAYMFSNNRFNALMMNEQDSAFFACMKKLQHSVCVGEINNIDEFNAFIKEKLSDRPDKVEKFCYDSIEEMQKYSSFYQRHIEPITQYKRVIENTQTDDQRGYSKDLAKLYDFFDVDKNVKCYGILVPVPKKEIDGCAIGNGFMIFYDTEKKDNEKYIENSFLPEKKVSTPLHEATHVLFGHSKIKQDLKNNQGKGAHKLLSVLDKYFSDNPDPNGRSAILAVDEAIAACSSMVVNKKYKPKENFDVFYHGFEGANALAKSLYPVFQEYMKQDKKMDDDFFMQVATGFEMQQKIENARKRLPYSSPVLQVKTIDELRGIRSNKASKPVKQTTLDVAAVKQKTIQNEG